MVGTCAITGAGQDTHAARHIAAMTLEALQRMAVDVKGLVKFLIRSRMYVPLLESTKIRTRPAFAAFPVTKGIDGGHADAVRRSGGAAWAVQEPRVAPA